MKAAVLNAIPGELDIQDVQVDNPSYGEVLIRVVAAGVCHSDLHFTEGKYFYPTPCVLGHESAGVVEAVGDGVTYVQPGDHVITCLSVFCGECEYCLTGHPSLCQSPTLQRAPDDAPRLTRDGTPVFQFLNLSSYAEMMLVHQHAVVKIVPEMPLDRAALIGCGVTTGLGAVFHTADVEPGASVAVIGCGGVGLSAIQGARIAGAGRIIAVDVTPGKLDIAMKMGATDVVNAADTDPVSTIQELTGGGVHYSFEAIGMKLAAEQAFQMLRRGGTATVIGMIPMGVNLELAGTEFLSEKKIQGSTMGSNRFRVDMPRFVDFYLSGRLNLDDLITNEYQLDDVNTALSALAKGEVTRSIITFG